MESLATVLVISARGPPWASVSSSVHMHCLMGSTDGYASGLSALLTVIKKKKSDIQIFDNPESQKEKVE